MTRNTLYSLLLLPCLLFSVLFAQNPVVNDPEVEAYKSEAVQLVSFLQFLMNTVGDPNSTARDKETIIQNSFSKVFKNAQVQIEDDLIEGRSVITQKDVQAYLKDIDFFYKEATFELNIEKVEDQINDFGEMFLLISMSRHLKGITHEGVAVNSVKPRFIEVNIDEAMRDMKIASFYTTKLSRDEELSEWWMGLAFDWQSLFSKELNFGVDMGMKELRQRIDTVYLEDSVLMDIRTVSMLSKHTISELEKLMLVDELDISDNPSLTDLNALAKLSHLKKLDVSGTQIRDISPIRNLTRLEVFNCSNSLIQDISPLQYAINLRELNANQTRIKSLSVLEKLPNLTHLDVSNTPLVNMGALVGLVGLKELNLSKTGIDDIAELATLKNLQRLDLQGTNLSGLFGVGEMSSLKELNIESTPLIDLNPLRAAQNLEVLYADQSGINSLTPLSGLRNLRKVYCDNTAITEEDAQSFMRKNPKILVISGSANLQDWWKGMSPIWKEVFRKQLPFEDEPGRDQLQVLVNAEKLSLRDMRQIRSLEPVQAMRNLKEINLSNSGVLDLKPLAELTSLEYIYADSSSISDLSPLESLAKLKEITFSNTSVASLEPLRSLFNLELINADYTSIRSILPVKGLLSLKQMYCQDSEIKDTEAKEFLTRIPKCLLIYRTSRLEEWWEKTPLAWKSYFRTIEYLEDNPDAETLHALTQKRSLNIQGNMEIRDFYPLNAFIVLEELSFTKTRISDLRHLSTLTSLKVLDCSQNPISDLGPLAYLQELHTLSFNNTPLAKLDPISRLTQLKTLKCAGTQIKDLDPLSSLRELQNLDISNTSVRSLKALQPLFDLQTLTCFNTKLSDAKVQKFKQAHPTTEVVHY